MTDARVTPQRRKASASASRWLAVLAVFAVGVLGLSACSTIDKVKGAIQDVRGNKAVVDDFNSKLNTAPTTFQANYTTTGSSPATVTYAAQLPDDVAFTLTPTAGSGTSPVHLVQNSSGQYGCNQSSSGQWSCAKLAGATGLSQNDVIDFYTPGHWQKFLSGVALAAGFAGDKVTTSTMSLNGFDMSCIDLVASGVAGKSTICTTSQGVLGYVNVAGDSTSFEITSFSSSPSASLFQLPPGATITTVTVPTTTSTT